MKVLYRPHMSGLSESMEKLKEFINVEDLLKYLCIDSNISSFNDINISYYCYDNRIKWHTYIVTVNRCCGVDYLKKYNHSMPIGFMTFIY